MKHKGDPEDTTDHKGHMGKCDSCGQDMWTYTRKVCRNCYAKEYGHSYARRDKLTRYKYISLEGVVIYDKH
jgi:hypothetical protein